MKKKSDISKKVEELENAENKTAKQDKIQYGPGKRGMMVGVTAGICAVLVVGGYFLVGKLVDLSNENQTSNAPETSYDSGSFIPGDIIHTSGNGDTDISDSNSSSTGDGADDTGNAPGNTPGNAPGGDGSVSPSGDPTAPRGDSPADTSSRDTGAMTDPGDGGEPVESGIIVPGGGIGGSIIVPDNKQDIYPSGDMTVPPSAGGEITDAGSGEYADPEYTVPAATVPEYTTGAGTWTTAAPHKPSSTTRAATTKSSTAARTTARSGESTTSSGTTATTKKQDEPDDSWDRLPDISDLETVEPFEGKLGDFFH